VERHNRRLYRIARGILRNDSEAEDLVQEAYVYAERLAADRGHLSEPDDPEAYKQRDHSYDAMRAPAWRLLKKGNISCPRQTFPSFATPWRGGKRAALLPWRA
jgi:hypothetical protein